MIAIIGAMEIEIAKIKTKIEQLHITSIANREFYKGKIYDKDVVLVKAGIGKVNAAITTTLLFQLFDIDYVINVGVAGGVTMNAKSVIFADKLIYHDVDATNFGYELGQVPGETKVFHVAEFLLDDLKRCAEQMGLDYTVGTIGTGDQFIRSQDMLGEILQEETIHAVEMEGAAIAQVCDQFNKPFLAIRSISDKIGEDDQTTDYREFSEHAANLATQIVDKLLKG